MLIATGSRPAMPAVPGIEHAISSDGFFELPELPWRVLLIGAACVGVELRVLAGAPNASARRCGLRRR